MCLLEVNRASEKKAEELIQMFFNGDLDRVSMEINRMPLVIALPVVARMAAWFAKLDEKRPLASNGKPYAPYLMNAFLMLLEG